MRESRIECIFCGRKIKRSHAVPVYKTTRLENIPVLSGKLKGYCCISCARFRGISFADWRQKTVFSERKIIEERRKKALGKKK